MAFDECRRQIAKELETRFHHYDNDPLNPRFAPNSLIRDIFTHDLHALLQRLFKACHRVQHFRDNRQLSMTSEEFIRRLRPSGTDDIQRTFATLLTVDMNAAFFGDWLASLVDSEKPPITDARLPLSVDAAREAFNGQGLSFYDKQFVWCPMVLHFGQRVEYIDDRRFCPLPRLKREAIGYGSFGDVHEVKLDDGAIEFKYGSSRKQLFVQKEFTVKRGRREAFEAEWRVTQDILRARRTHKNIMRPLAALLSGNHMDPSTMHFSMFFDVATCNLREYLYGQQNSKPTESYPPGGLKSDQKQQIIWQAISLVDAVGHLHGGFEFEHSSGSQCFWHLDLKAQNVLVTLSPTDNRPLFQISDFGLSRMKRLRRWFDGREGNDVDPTELLRPSCESSSTLARGGDGSECLAPEAYGEGAKVRESSDIWSLGCILAMLFTFVEGGPTAVQSFAEDRARWPENGSWFFSQLVNDASTPALSFYHAEEHRYITRKQAVDDKFAYLKMLARLAERPSLGGYLDVVLQDMLVPDPLLRASARQSYKDLIAVRHGSRSTSEQSVLPRRDLAGYACG